MGFYSIGGGSGGISPNQLDAFSRLRVSQETTLLEIKQTHDQAPDFVDIVTGGTGSESYNTGEASTTLATVADGDYAIAQTIQRASYSAGKSQLVFMTQYNFQPEENIIKRSGYFSSSTVAPYSANLDGIFFESSGGEVSINIYRNGTAVHSVGESAWMPNTPTNIDWSQNQIFVIDFQYLGVGRVRFYLDIDGDLVLLHEANNANLNQKAYMSSPNKPLRWEIRQTGAGSGALTYVCGSVSSEGSINQLGRYKEAFTPAFINADSTALTYGLLGMRLKSTRLDQVVDLLSISINSVTNDDVHWSIIKNPTVAGAVSFTSAGDSSAIEIHYCATDGSNTLTGGTRIAGGYIKANDTTSKDLITSDRLGALIDGTSSRFYLAVEPLSSLLDIYGEIDWRETL